MISFDVCYIIYFYNTLCKVTVPKLQFLLSMAHLFVEYTVKFAIRYFCNIEYVKKEKFNFNNVLFLNEKITQRNFLPPYDSVRLNTLKTAVWNLYYCRIFLALCDGLA